MRLVCRELTYGRGRESKTGRENCKRREKIGVRSPSTGPLISITSGALGLSSYARAHIHMHLLYLCPLLLNVPLWDCHTTKCLIGYLAAESIILSQTEEARSRCSTGGSTLKSDGSVQGAAHFRVTAPLKTRNICKLAGLHSSQCTVYMVVKQRTLATLLIINVSFSFCFNM